MKKLKEMRKNQKGFTLVELIVVLVILAILAAMLVPALLGYIDRAKEGKYEEEVHSIYTALQVVFDEAYAKSETEIALNDATKGYLKEVNDMIAPAKVTDITAVETNGGAATVNNKTVTVGGSTKEYYAIKGFTVEFTSQDATRKLGGKLSGGVVSVDLTNATTTPES